MSAVPTKAAWRMGENAPHATLLVAISLLTGLPLLFMVFGSLWSAAPGAPDGHLTLAGWREVLGSADLWRALGNTLLLGTATAVVSAVIGTALAFLFARVDLPGARLWESLLTISLYLSPFMLTLAWVGLAGPQAGFVNVLWKNLGGSGTLLNAYSFPCMVWVLASHYVPYVFLSLLGPLRAIDSSLEEASLVLGGGRVRGFFKITLPLIFPAIFASGIMVTILAAENFAVPTLLGRTQNFQTIPSEIYLWLSYEPTRPGLAAVAGVILLVMSLLGVVAYRRVIRNASRFRTMTGKPKRIQPLALGKYRWPVSLALSAYLAASVVVPLGALFVGSLLKYITPNLKWSLFTLQQYERALSGDNLTGLINSVVLAVGTATIVTLLGAAVSYSVTRSKGRGRTVMDYVSVAGAAVPGIVLGVGMLWAYVSMPLPIYGTIWILLIAYVARFLAHGVRVCGSTLLHVSSEFEEAAQVLGSGLLSRLRRIVFPLIARGMASTWILIFIFTLNEVSATVILYSPSNITLAVLAWQSLEMQGAMQAFAFACLQTAMIFFALLVMRLVVGRVADPEAAYR
ncbi:MAG TPA: iron ABC transporter permease [Usitatibacter sp.]|nr:iron ABC transporter permease [Usitatibacter sp.]